MLSVRLRLSMKSQFARQDANSRFFFYNSISFYTFQSSQNWLLLIVEWVVYIGRPLSLHQKIAQFSAYFVDYNLTHTITNKSYTKSFLLQNHFILIFVQEVLAITIIRSSCRWIISIRKKCRAPSTQYNMMRLYVIDFNKLPTMIKVLHSLLQKVGSGVSSLLLLLLNKLSRSI